MSKDILLRRIQDQIDEWNAEIEALKAKAASYERRIEELREERDAAMHKLEELRRATDPGFQTTAENWGEGM